MIGAALFSGPVAEFDSLDHITYLSVVVGMMRAGIVAAPISLSNSETAVAHLLQSVSATHVLVSEDAKTRALVEAAISTLDEGSKGERGVVPKVISMPRFSDIYTDEEVQFLPERKYDYLSPALYLHSSGRLSLCREPSALTIRSSRIFVPPKIDHLDSCALYASRTLRS